MNSRVFTFECVQISPVARSTGLFVLRFAAESAAMPWEHSLHYHDGKYQYKVVVVPEEVASRLPEGSLKPERWWVDNGIQQTPRWVHVQTWSSQEGVSVLFRREIAACAATADDDSTAGS